MGDKCGDYLDTYRNFFERFALTVDPSDQLPVKVAGYNVTESEIVGAVGDWVLQYLEQRQCPASLSAHLARKVVEEVRVLAKVDPHVCGYRSECEDFLTLKLMQTCITKLINVCGRYRDNAELSKLAPPLPAPLVTSYAVKNSRRSMEDRHVIIHDFHSLFNIKDHGPASYYGVFDGHNGTDAAIYSVSHLHQYLAESRHYPTNPMLALREACVTTDDMFTMKAERENLHGGTTAVFALLRPKDRKLYVAWLGDSQAVLVRRGVPLQIVRPHKPDRSDERERIEGMGGTVLFWGVWRVNGQLAVSRAIGDVEYKPYVTAEPDIEEITLDGSEDFLILACDGLWDFVTDQEATDAVINTLKNNPEDLESVSHRLVSLAKEQSSQDNISVVVVFLKDPREVASRRMETATPAAEAFMQRNGGELFCTPATLNGQYDENEDFGPETDVDMVDDVLLSPAIAAAKALVQGKDLDDEERQRQQLRDFDDPEDMSRDTPTPPAHEVGGNANAEPLGDSGEESEEEWNYIPGKENNPAKPDSQTQEEDDMSSQLNPNAAEFVPVSPTRLLMLDDAIISASSYHHDESLDEVKIPTELDFDHEISQRPSDREYTNGFNHGDDYFMRDNFSTLRNKTKDINVSSTCAELGDSSILSLNSSFNNSASEVTPFDKMEEVQTMPNKENLFTDNIDFSNDAFGTTSIFGKGDPMTTSIIGLGSSSDVDESLIPGTPKSTEVEAPASPSNDDVSPLNHHVDLGSSDDEAEKSPACVEEIQSGLKKSESSEFEPESRAAEGELHSQDDNEGFITEHRRSPPIDLSFKPIQHFSDTNPFGPLQTPTTATPLDHVENFTDSANLHTPKAMRFEAGDSNNTFDHIDLAQNTPTSFISVRSPGEVPVAFDDLESPKEPLQFEPPPILDASSLVQLQTSEPEENLAAPLVTEAHHENTTPEEPEVVEVNSPCEETTADFLAEESKILQDELECEQHSKLEEEPNQSETQLSDVISPIETSPKILTAFEDIKNLVDSEIESQDKLDIEVETKEMNLEFESHIAQTDITPDELKNLDEGFEVISKDELTLADRLPETSDTTSPLLSPSKKTNPFITDDDLSDIPVVEAKIEDQVQKRDFLSAIESFNSAITEDIIEQETESPLLSAQVDFAPEPVATKTVTYQTLTPAEEPQLSKTAAYITGIDEIPAENSRTIEETSVSFVEEPIVQETPVPVVQETPVQIVQETAVPIVEESLVPDVEEKSEPIIEDKSVPVAEEIVPVAEEKLKPAEEEAPTEPIILKRLEQETVASPVEFDPVVIPTVNEPVESQVVTETLITALEEKSEVPPVAMEVTSSAGTPPPTPAPGVEDNKDTEKTDILVAAVAAAGAVAAGTAAVKVAEKEVKKSTTTTAAKKPAVGVAKKPTEVTKAPAKSVPAKPLAAKPAPTKTTTTAKPASATKPTSATTAAKPAAAKPASAPAGVKKPATAAPAKPASATAAKPTTAAAKPAAKPATTATGPKPTSTTAAKQVPTKLAVSKTTLAPAKPSSKPSTPTSKPTTPTTPKSPSVKSDAVKSPPRPAVRSTLTKPAADKKPLTNGDVKTTAAKKPEDVKKPLASKPAAPARSAVSSTKPAVSSTKPATTAAKSAPAKPAAAAAPKKPAAPTTAAPAKPAPIKRPTSAAVPKPADKPAKEAGKPLTSAKPAVNGKAAPAKPASGVKKTDAKVNGKSSPVKPVSAKKIEDVKKEEETIAIQEANITTTNGFSDHEHEVNGISEIENVAPVLVDGVN